MRQKGHRVIGGYNSLGTSKPSLDITRFKIKLAIGTRADIAIKLLENAIARYRLVAKTVPLDIEGFNSPLGDPVTTRHHGNKVTGWVFLI